MGMVAGWDIGAENTDGYGRGGGIIDAYGAVVGGGTLSYAVGLKMMLEVDVVITGVADWMVTVWVAEERLHAMTMSTTAHTRSSPSPTRKRNCPAKLPRPPKTSSIPTRVRHPRTMPATLMRIFAIDMQRWPDAQHAHAQHEMMARMRFSTSRTRQMMAKSCTLRTTHEFLKQSSKLKRLMVMLVKSP